MKSWPELKISLLGTFQALLDDAPISTFESNKVRALLAYLAVEYDRVHRREAVAELLWPDWPKQSSLRNLSYALADLRKKIADHAAQPSFLLITRDSLGINLESNAWIDVRELTTGLSMPMTSNPPESVIKALEQAVKLASGPLLEGFSLDDSPAFETWLLTQREHYNQLVLQTLDFLIDWRMKHKENTQAENMALHQIKLEPSHEKAYQQLMRLLYFKGDRVKALSQYENLQRVLRQEMDVEPSAETIQLYHQIRMGNLEEQKGSRPPVISIPSLTTGTYTFLFTDIEESTRLFQDYPVEMQSALTRHNLIIQAEVKANRGTIFQIVGDGINVAFPTASEALNCAITAQRSLLNEDWGRLGSIRVRMGLHTGAADFNPADTLSGQFHGYLTLTRAQRILACGHGNQILLSQAVVELLGDQLPAGTALKDLGEHRLKGLAGTERIYQVIAVGLLDDFPPLNTASAAPNNLPIQVTSFIGRKPQISDIVKCLDPGTGSNRCLTLVGPGGCGKTRLALEAASELAQSFTDGIWLVGLAPVTEPKMIPKLVIEELGLREDGKRSPLKVLTDYLEYKKLLLILDNCEHLVDNCALMIESILKAAPYLRILSTSREALGISAETVFRVPSLQLPEKNKTGMINLADCEAIQLFVERARAVFPEFSVNAQNGEAVTQVCQRLEGIPLAIELAAAWTPMLRVEQILAHLDDAFHFLTGGSRVAMLRQQTLRATLDWSYNLLGDPERTLLTRLSVFTAGFRLDAAEAVCAGEPISGQDILAILYQLVKKSLVNVEHIQGMDTRFRLLETTRLYCAEKMLLNNDISWIHSQHLQFFSQLAQQAAKELEGAGQYEWMLRLDEEYENIRAALTWSFGNETGPGVKLVASLGYFWFLHGDWVDAHHWHEKALDVVPDIPAHLRAQILTWEGSMVSFLEGIEPAKALYAESIALFRQQGIVEQAVTALCFLSLIQESDSVNAFAFAEESLELSKKVGNLWGQRRALCSLGILLQNQNNYAQAEVNFKQALEISQRIGDLDGIAWSLYNLGSVYYYRGELSQSVEFHKQSLSIAQKMENLPIISWSTEKIGWTLMTSGQIQLSRQYLEQSLETYRKLGDTYNLSVVMIDLGMVEMRLGNTVQARQLLTQCMELRREMDSQTAYPRALNYQALFELLNGNPIEAKKLIHTSLEMVRNLNNEFELIVPLCHFGLITLQEGGYEDAKRHLSESLELSIKKDLIDFTVLAYYGLGAVACMQNNYTEAIERWSECLVFSEKMEGQELISQCYSGLAIIATKLGDLVCSVKLGAAAEQAIPYLDRILLPVLRFRFRETLASARNKIGEAAYDIAWTEGQTISFQSVQGLIEHLFTLEHRSKGENTNSR